MDVRDGKLNRGSIFCDGQTQIAMDGKRVGVTLWTRGADMIYTFGRTPQWASFPAAERAE
jgi:hypothetical protein